MNDIFMNVFSYWLRPRTAMEGHALERDLKLFWKRDGWLYHIFFQNIKKNINRVFILQYQELLRVSYATFH